ncbi:MAG: hypothetical protein DWQ08_14950 [Proteobacteria bacterium]|nr:MAG: hypothetical protein DWQ08_14950 [Pseudomonadota bacterium]
MQWKKQIKAAFDEPACDLAEAQSRARESGGMATGVIYAERRPVWPIEHEVRQRTVESLSRDFVL